MSQSGDPDDFLGWAPDLGSWETTVTPSAGTATQRPVATPPHRPPPQPEPEAWTRPLPSARVVPREPPRPRTARKPDPPAPMPILVAFVIMLVATFWMALQMSGSAAQGSPVGLLVCGVVTVLLGRVLWSRLRG